MGSPMACTMHATEHPAKHLSKTCPCSPRPMLRLGTRSPCAGQQAVQPRREARTPLRRARTFSSALDDGWVGDATIEILLPLHKAALVIGEPAGVSDARKQWQTIHPCPT